MRKRIFILSTLLSVVLFCSCTDNEIEEPVVSNSVNDMEILSRFVDVNATTNEYYINEHKKTRALSYITDADWKDLEKVSPLSVEKYKKELQMLNSQIASSIADPKTAYVVFSVNGKTLVKKVKDNTTFTFSKAEYIIANNTRAVYPTLSINGGASSTTGSFKDASRTMNMEVKINASIQNSYYFFEVLNPNAKPNPDDNITTPESVAFSGTGPLWNTMFTWTAYWDAQDKNDKMFKWEFKGKGTTPSFGFIADCSFRP